MKKTIYLGLAMICLTGMVFAQEAKRIDIAGFEGFDFEWKFTDASVVNSYAAEKPLEGGAVPKAGTQVLAVEYDNNVGGAWAYGTMNLPEPLDLTGMTEIHMWVFVVKEKTVGRTQFRLDLPGGIGLGYRDVPSDQWGKWVELVWGMDHITSTEKISSVGALNGFIAPDNATDSGMVYIDEVYAYRPVGTPNEYQEALVWGFNESDPATGYPKGWTIGGSPEFKLADADLLKDVQPSEGTNFGMFAIGSAWVHDVTSADALTAFDRWPQVLEIMVDARVQSDFAGGWLNFQLVLQSNQTTWDAYGEMGLNTYKDNWATFLWKVDISKHLTAFDPATEGRYFQVGFATNQAAGDEGKFIYIDNFKVVIPKVTAVSDWPLF